VVSPVRSPLLRTKHEFEQFGRIALVRGSMSPDPKGLALIFQ
jgi:hypothetical protein